MNTAKLFTRPKSHLRSSHLSLITPFLPVESSSTHSMAAARLVLPPRCLAGTSWPVRTIPNASTCNFSALANPPCPFQGNHVTPNNPHILTIHPGHGNKSTPNLSTFTTSPNSQPHTFIS